MWAVIGVVAAVVIAVLIWLLPKKKKAVPAGYVVIPLLGCDDPEQRVRNAYWDERFRSAANRRDIIIVTDNRSEQRFTAARLAAELEGVEAVDITALADHIIRKERIRQP